MLWVYHSRALSVGTQPKNARTTIASVVCWAQPSITGPETNLTRFRTRRFGAFPHWFIGLWRPELIRYGPDVVRCVTHVSLGGLTASAHWSRQCGNAEICPSVEPISFGRLQVCQAHLTTVHHRRLANIDADIHVSSHLSIEHQIFPRRCLKR